MKMAWRFLLLGCLCMVGWVSAMAEDLLTLGIFGHRPQEQIEQSYLPLTHYLSKQLGGTPVVLRVMSQVEIEQALEERRLDMVLTNPSHYTKLRTRTLFTGALATLVTMESGLPTSRLGGVIVVRADNERITQLADLRGHKIATPGTAFLGGYQVQAYELLQAGIPPDAVHLDEVNTHDAALDAVLSGKADAAFIRTGIIEELAHAGKIDVNALRVVNAQTVPGFPYRVSTRLYPEWAFVALPHIPDRTIRRIAASLLALDENHPVARAAGIGGFAPPGDYLSVEVLPRALRLPPFDQAPEFTFREVWQRWFGLWIILILAVGGLMILAVLRLLGRNRELLRLEDERRHAEHKLRVAAAAFESREAMLITDAHDHILQVNQAFVEITGYPAVEAIGATPRILDSGRHDEDFFATISRCLDEAGNWQGEVWLRRKNGEFFPVWQTISLVHDEQGRVTNSVRAFSDITRHKASEEEIRHLAFFDSLTHLPNRRLMLDRLRQTMLSNERSQRHGALLFIDLDNFKSLNDTYGHSKGDILLQKVARRLTGCVREGDTVARLGGDEFVVILENLSHKPAAAVAQAQAVGEKIVAALGRPYKIDEITHRSTPSIGITLFGTPEDNSEDVMRRADLAMYEAKRAGRNTLRFFDPEMQAEVAARIELEAALLKAVTENQLLLHYQPQVDVEGRVVGAEALLRWLHPERGMVSPAEFIPLAEQSGLIVPIGFWVLREACTQLARWAVLPALSSLTLSVNVSARQFSMPTFVNEVKDLIGAFAINPALIKIELTESLLFDNTSEVIAKMSVLKELGVQFSLDDFGTGYSSLAYLKRLPLEQIKIDQSFVRDLERDENDALICAATISLAHSLRYQVVAEGVETEAQRHFLTHVHRCDYMQGYLFSRPLPLAEFESFVVASRAPEATEVRAGEC